MVRTSRYPVIRTPVLRLVRISVSSVLRKRCRRRIAVRIDWNGLLTFLISSRRTFVPEASPPGHTRKSLKTQKTQKKEINLDISCAILCPDPWKTSLAATLCNYESHPPPPQRSKSKSETLWSRSRQRNPDSESLSVGESISPHRISQSSILDAVLCS